MKTTLSVYFAGYLVGLVALPLLAAAQSASLLLRETGSTITLSFLHDKEFPEDYRSIMFRTSGRTTTITGHDLIHRIPATLNERKSFLWVAETPSMKLDPSRFFMVGQYIVDAKPHTLLFFFSQGYASDAAPLLIVGFTEDGRPVKVFEREYELKSFEQGENGALIIGKETVPQTECDRADPKAPSSTTYDPYSVFLLRPDAKPLYLLDASRDYNRKHYVWAGPVMREDYAVIRNLPGHSRLIAVPASRADHILSSLNCTP